MWLKRIDVILEIMDSVAQKDRCDPGDYGQCDSRG